MYMVRNSLSREKKYLDECGPANFFAIKDGKYITPASDSILPSITNKSLMQLARDMGIEVEQRHIPIEELESIQEAAACGTAAVASMYAGRGGGEYAYVMKHGRTGHFMRVKPQPALAVDGESERGHLTRMSHVYGP